MLFRSQWATAFVPRTPVLHLLRQGWRHVTIDTFKYKMNDEGREISKAFQDYLVGELGFAPRTGAGGSGEEAQSVWWREINALGISMALRRSKPSAGIMQETPERVLSRQVGRAEWTSSFPSRAGRQQGGRSPVLSFMRNQSTTSGPCTRPLQPSPG